ncbi:tachykinin-like peptides receptor 86C [Montipora foliosa]|uniref:tachykinin-like peptides receptor 86C n=1 Tax=Montipora foliosa TaxID=591990 RepID=UPI0035F14233
MSEEEFTLKRYQSAVNVHAMNLSYSDQGSSFTVKFSTTSKVTITVLYAVTIMFGIAGNSIAIYFAIMKKAGNRVTNMLILNMTIADMLITIFAMPYSIIFLQVGLKWIGGILGQITCKIVHFSYQVSVPASIFTVMAVSLDRFFAVLYPAKVRALRKVKMTTLAIWVSSAVYAVPFIFAYDIQQQNGIYYCIRYFPPFDNEISSQIYYLITFICIYCIPLLILIVLYTLISRRLWQRKIPGNVSQERYKSSQQEKRRVILALIAIIVLFAVCWFPAHVIHYIFYFRKDVYRKISPEVEVLFFWLCHANSFINPCLYVFLSQGYRQHMRTILQRFTFCCTFYFRRKKIYSFRSGKGPGTLTLEASLRNPMSIVGVTFHREMVC